MAKRFDKLLVLDIDETLIYASDVAPVAEPDFWVGRYAIHRRPGVGEFLADAWIGSTWASGPPPPASMRRP